MSSIHTRPTTNAVVVAMAGMILPAISLLWNQTHIQYVQNLQNLVDRREWWIKQNSLKVTISCLLQLNCGLALPFLLFYFIKSEFSTLKMVSVGFEYWFIMFGCLGNKTVHSKFVSLSVYIPRVLYMRWSIHYDFDTCKSIRLQVTPPFSVQNVLNLALTHVSRTDFWQLHC